MNGTPRPARRTKALILGSVGGCAVLTVALNLGAVPGRDGRQSAPVFTTIEPAENPVDLVVFVDDRKVMGWITGDESYAGETVWITYPGSKHKATVGRDNTFVWEPDIASRVQATFQVGDLTRRESIDPAAAGKPAAFFVVDRTVYRPGQTLHFAAFLRTENARREFVPLVNQNVQVRLTSHAKSTVAVKMNVRSDEFGRVVGDYAFSEADALDSYTLAIPDYLGTAEVKLAEFRKAKVRLSIDGERKGQQLQLKFQALDFLNKPVPGSKVSFTAKVFKGKVFNDRANNEQRALSADEFVYQDGVIERLFNFEDATEDERLLTESGSVAAPRGRHVASATAELQGNVAVSASGFGECTLALERAWTRGAYSVLVEGVLVDYNGREQRASRIIHIGSKVTDCDLELEIDKRNFVTGEKIHVHICPRGADGKPVEATSTVMAMKLSPAVRQMPQFSPYGYGIYGGWNGVNGPHFWNGPGFGSGGWNETGRADVPDSHRMFVTASVAKNNTATFELDEPGAYKLVCVAELPGGRKLKNEVGCVVRKPRDMPSLILNLDRDQFKAGEQLSGEIHCRFDGAKVLLTIRDSTGVRVWKTYTVNDGVLRFSEPLAADLRYGVMVEVQYLESEKQFHVANRVIRVEPTDRTINIDIATQETYGPGDEVALDLKVDRREPVDLVVSVYDQSLLGIARDKSTNVRNFFLADERVSTSADRERLRRRLAGVTVRELVERIEQRLKDDAALANSPQVHQLVQLVDSYRKHHRVHGFALSALLKAAGVEAVQHQVYPHYGGWRWWWPADVEAEKTQSSTLFDVLAHVQSDWRMHRKFIGDRLLLFEYHPSNQNYIRQVLQSGQLLGGMGGYGMGPVGGNGAFSVSANAFAPFMPVSGQAFASHMPVFNTSGPGIDLLTDSTVDSAIRTDFSDSAFWNARVRTDRRGRATVRFKLPDSLTNWQVVVTAVSPRMHVGQAKSDFRTFKPIMVWPMIPRVFTEGDRVELYGSVHNRTDDEQVIEVSLKVNNGQVHSARTVTVRVPAKDNVPVYWEYEPEAAGFTQLLMTAKSKAGSDASLKRIPVARMAAEQVITASGFAKEEATLVIPTGINLDDSRLEITLVPSLLDDAMQSLDYLVQYPYGCVEQTMSRFLPALVVKETLDRAGVDNEPLEEKLPGVVAAGIKRLLELQQGDGGWGWHGGSATHEMMTPYALYGLLRAEKAGYTIPNDSAVEIGLNRLKQFIDSIKAEQASDRIYCMYVYSLRRDLDEKLWQFMESQLEDDKLSDYALAMCLEMAVAKEKKGLADRLVAALHRRVKRSPDAAFWTTAGFSRWGDDKFEITAAVLKALVAHDPRDRLIAPTLSFFATTKRGNRWNSTKDTAMIIYAICDYLATQNHQPGARRAIQVTVNDDVAYDIELSGGLLPKIEVPTRHLEHGPNRITFRGHAPGAMYRAVFAYWQRGEEIQPLEKGLVVERKFFLLDAAGKQLREIQRGDRVPQGSYIQSEVTVRHKLEQPMRYVLVENPKPATCEILPDTDKRFPQSSTAYALREDKTTGSIFHHEATGHTITDRSVLHAELAGEYLVPPARVELMYETLTRGHSGAFDFRVGQDPVKVGAAR